jgi:GxxExxY protein
MSELRRNDLIYPELSFQIVGALLDVYSQLGHGLYEKVYQRATAAAFKKRNLGFKEQLYAPVFFDGQRVGINYLDFLVENRVVVELKRGINLLKPILTSYIIIWCPKNYNWVFWLILGRSRCILKG